MTPFDVWADENLVRDWLRAGGRMVDSALGVVQDIRFWISVEYSPFAASRENRIPAGAWVLLHDAHNEDTLSTFCTTLLLDAGDFRRNLPLLRQVFLVIRVVFVCRWS